MLERFLFLPAQQQQPISGLSGGEKKRIQILLTLMNNPNVLILDEPTNDLDLTTISVLEDFLLSFTGCLIIISHDRSLLDKITDELLIFHGDGVIQHYAGTYSMYKQTSPNTTPKTDSKKIADPTPVAVRPKSTKLSYVEQREFDTLADQIETIEHRQEAINLLFQKQTLSHEEIKELSKELSRISAEHEIKEARWYELAERG